MINIYDTSALLNINPTSFDKYTRVSFVVLQELEDIKTNISKDENVRARARNLVKILISQPEKLEMKALSRKEVKKVQNICLSIGLPLTNDNLILAETEYIRQVTEGNFQRSESTCNFYTSDGLQYLNCMIRFPKLNAIFVNGQFKETIWPGYQMIEDDNIVNSVVPNEYIVSSERIRRFLDNDRGFEIIEPQNIRSIMLGEIKPLNREQIMAFDLLSQDHIKVKLLTGVFGSGKDLLMFSRAISDVEKGKFNKIVYFRNAVQLADAAEVGFLKGTLEEKTSWVFGPIVDKIGSYEGIETLMDNNQLEFCHLPFARGRSWDNCILYVTEGQNLSSSQIALLLGRCGPKTQLWINGDIKQTDSKIFERDNGIKKLIEKLKGNPLFGHVYMPNTLRSNVAELANLIT